MLFQKSLEPELSCLQLRSSVYETSLGEHHLSKTPIYLRVAGGKSPAKQGFRLFNLLVTQVDLRQVHACLDIARHIFNGFSIPPCSPTQLWFRHKFSPQNA